jgi:hypothetical protein
LAFLLRLLSLFSFYYILHKSIVPQSMANSFGSAYFGVTKGPFFVKPSVHVRKMEICALYHKIRFTATRVSMRAYHLQVYQNLLNSFFCVLFSFLILSVHSIFSILLQPQDSKASSPFWSAFPMVHASCP